MLSSAVKILCAAIAVSNQTQVTSAERDALARITPSIAVLFVNGTPTGSAACIDSRGYFIAHRSAAPAHRLRGRLFSGATIDLVLTSTDEPTQLVLLEAENWTPGMALPASVTDGDEVPGKTLIAILPFGAIRAKFAATDRLGVLTASRRMVPLSEVRFEDKGTSISGALIFSYDGHLLGALNATLGSPGQSQIGSNNQVSVGGGGGRGWDRDSTSGSTKSAVTADEVKPQAQSLLQLPKNAAIGPGGLTVGYTIGPDEIRRVVAGFRSPSKEVLHPAVGLYCKDALTGGALIATVQGNSPAEQAKLKSGDVIVEIGGKPIKNQFDFAKVMLKQQVGAKVNFKVVRDGVTQTIEVIVGKQSN